MIRAASVMVSTASIQEAGAGSILSAALHLLRVRPLPIRVAKALLVREHYLHSLPGGTCLAFGTFVCSRLLGALTFGVGPTNAHRLVEGHWLGQLQSCPVHPYRVNLEFPEFSFLIGRPHIFISLFHENAGKHPPFIAIGMPVSVVIQ